MSAAPATLKQRLVIMGLVNVAAVAGAGVLLVSYMKFGQGWALPAIFGAMAVGFGAQIWFIASVRKFGKEA